MVATRKAFEEAGVIFTEPTKTRERSRLTSRPPHEGARNEPGTQDDLRLYPEPKFALYVFGRQGDPLSPASAGLFLDQAMNQPVSGSPVVTHHLGALIALGTLLAINLVWMSKFFFGWW